MSGCAGPHHEQQHDEQARVHHDEGSRRRQGREGRRPGPGDGTPGERGNRARRGQGGQRPLPELNAMRTNACDRQW